MTKKNIRTAKRWAFPIAAAAFAILQITKGETLLALWASLAGVFDLVATLFGERCEDLEDDVKDWIKSNHDLAEALQHKDGEIAELYQEINRLRDELKK